MMIRRLSCKSRAASIGGQELEDPVDECPAERAVGHDSSDACFVEQHQGWYMKMRFRSLTVLHLPGLFNGTDRGSVLPIDVFER